MSAIDLLTSLGGALVVAFDPLRRALSSPAKLTALLAREGWRADAESVTTALASALALGGDVDRVMTALDDLAGGSISLDDVNAAVGAASQLLHDLDAIGRPAGELPAPLDREEFWASFPVDLVHDLLATYIRQAHPVLFAPLYVLGVIDEQAIAAPDGDDARVPYVKQRLRWDRLIPVVSDPASLVHDVYGWGGTFDHGKLLLRLETALRTLGVLVGRQAPHGALVRHYYSSDPPADLRVLRATLLREQRAAGGVELGLAALPIPPAGGGAPDGLFIGPIVEGAAGTDLALAGPFTLHLGGGLEAGGVVGVELHPGRAVPRIDGAGATLAMSVALAAKPGEPWTLIGSEHSDRLQLADLTLGLELAGALADPELRLRLQTTALRVVIDPGDSDGFLQSLLGSDPQRVEISGALVWSSKTGVHLEGQAGLRRTIPIDVAFGPVQLSQLALEISASNNRLAIGLGVTGSVRLGPVIASVEQVGVAVALTASSPPARGTFGDLDVGFGFKPPIGLGLSIDAPVISGGGFLSFDSDAGRYAGALHVKIAGIIDIAAFGSLDTGSASQHWSLVIILAGHIPPVELGWNFRLTGLGGILALHRRMDSDALRDAANGVAGTLDDLLFPDSPETRLPQLLASIDRFFPPSAGSYVAGPMAEIEWGRDAAVNARIRAALLLQLDGQKIALYGTVRIGFPTVDSDATLRIRAAIEALVDMRDNLARFSITLIEGKLFQSIQITGGAAFFVRWGSGREFVFTIGGFHPAYRPYIPAGLIEPPRVGVHWHPLSGVALDLTQYFAITSTSMQFGAAAHAEVGVSWGKVTADIAFNVLVMTSPSLQLEADLHARVTVSVFGADLLSAGLDGSLVGPGPWVFSGKVEWKVWIFGISKSFHFEWGDRISIPAAPQSAGAILGAEMQSPANWTSFRTRSLPVKIRSGVTAPLAPTDEIEVRQSRLPFDTPIETLEGNPLSDAGTWTLTVTSASGIVKLFDLAAVFPERRFLAQPSKERPFRSGLHCGAHLARPDWDISTVAIAVDSTATDDVVIDGGGTVAGAVALPPPAVPNGIASSVAATGRARGFGAGATLELAR